MRCALLGAVLVSALGCGGRNRLNGTISGDASLAFDEVRAEWIVDQLVIRYVKGQGQVLAEAARLTLPEGAADAGVELPIERSVQVEHFVGTADDVGRVVTEKPFPAVSRGVLHLTRVGRIAGQLVEGDFQITFVGAEDTLDGEFSAPVTAQR
jgi:hypothetical protein